MSTRAGTRSARTATTTWLHQLYGYNEGSAGEGLPGDVCVALLHAGARAWPACLLLSAVRTRLLLQCDGPTGL